METTILGTQSPYRVEAFGGLVIPKDCFFYTRLPYLLARAGNEDALQDLMMIVTRVRRCRGTRYWGIVEGKSMPNMAGVEHSMKGVRQ